MPELDNLRIAVENLIAKKSESNLVHQLEDRIENLHKELTDILDKINSVLTAAPSSGVSNMAATDTIESIPITADEVKIPS